VYDGTISFIHAVRSKGIATAIVSASANTVQVLQVAGIADLFDVRVDGVIAKERGLRGKPAPDSFLAAAAELKVLANHAVVFEDAQSGWPRPGGSLRPGGRRGPGRPGGAAQAARADIVVKDVAELLDKDAPAGEDAPRAASVL